MNERIQPDFSVQVKFDDENSFLVDRTYDHIHVYSWLGYGILKLITEEGVLGISLPESDALRIAETAGIIPIMRQEISEREYAQYLAFSEAMLGDDWLQT
jgi:hypothetical protein